MATVIKGTKVFGVKLTTEQEVAEAQRQARLVPCRGCGKQIEPVSRLCRRCAGERRMEINRVREGMVLVGSVEEAMVRFRARVAQREEG